LIVRFADISGKPGRGRGRARAQVCSDPILMSTIFYAVGSASLTGMDLVRGLIEVKGPLGWTSMVVGARTTPDVILELHESDPASAWLVFAAPIDGPRIARLLAAALEAPLMLVQLELTAAPHRAVFSELEVRPDGSTLDVDGGDSFDADLDAGEQPADDARRMIISSLDLDTETRRLTRLPYLVDRKRAKR
jgi:hypothetical protein